MGRKRKCLPDEDEIPVVQRNSANARERNRMRVLSRAFVKLKTTLPWVPPDTKLSKLDTLRLATCYIAHLRQILAEDSEENIVENADGTFSHPLNLTWPFSFASLGPKSLDGSPTSSPEYRGGREMSTGTTYPLQQQQQQQQQQQHQRLASS